MQGKWIWIWNWKNCDGGDLDAVAARCLDAGVGVIVKHDDGGHVFGQSLPINQIVRGLQQRGVPVALWGFVYGRQGPFYGSQAFGWEAEADMAIQAAKLHPDAYVVDVEAEYEGWLVAADGTVFAVPGYDPHLTAFNYLLKIKLQAPDLPLYYAPLAQPNYHPRLPYEEFNKFCLGAMPQAYHNAMQVSPQRSLELTYNAFARRGLMLPIQPAGGAYGTVTAAELLTWAREALTYGATGLSWWSYEHMSEELWQAVKEIEMVTAEDVAKLQTQIDDLKTKLEGTYNALLTDISGDFIHKAELDALTERVTKLEGGPP